MKINRDLILQRHQHGFTLLELLVVVAIIAILAAILFPVFSRARENARRSSCQSNLKQIGMTLLQYSQDYDEIIVGHYFKGFEGDDHPGAYRWMDAIYPYVKSQAVFDCPSDTSIDKYVYRQPAQIHTTGSYGSYGINNAYWGESGISGAASALDHNKLLALSDLQTPSTTVWVTDTSRILAYQNNNFEIQWENIAAAPTSVGGGEPPSLSDMSARHLNNVSVLYCDGHVKSVNLNSLLKTNQSGVLTYFTAAQDPN